jgi:hypothetical protein
MKNWRVLSLVAVLVAAVFIWQMLPPAAKAEEMKLPPGVTLKIDKKFDGQGIPGVKEIMGGRVLMAPGSSWKDQTQDAKTWDFCFQEVGPMIVVANGKTSTIATGTLWQVLPGTKFSLENKSKVTVVDAFWEITLQ